MNFNLSSKNGKNTVSRSDCLNSEKKYEIFISLEELNSIKISSCSISKFALKQVLKFFGVN